MLSILGISPTINVAGLTDAQLRSIAGNSMSVAFLVRLLIVALLHVDFHTVLSAAQPSQQRPGKIRKSRRSASVTTSQHAAACLYEVPPHPYTRPSQLVRTHLPGLARCKKDYVCITNMVTPDDVPCGTDQVADADSEDVVACDLPGGLPFLKEGFLCFAVVMRRDTDQRTACS